MLSNWYAPGEEAEKDSVFDDRILLLGEKFTPLHLKLYRILGISVLRIHWQFGSKPWAGSPEAGRIGVTPPPPGLNRGSLILYINTMNLIVS